MQRNAFDFDFRAHVQPVCSNFGVVNCLPFSFPIASLMLASDTVKASVQAAVKVMAFVLAQHYATPTPSPDAVTWYVTSFMAWLGAWSAFLEFLPNSMKMKLQYLSTFVADMQFTLSTHIGRCCLDQRADDLKIDPGHKTWSDFDTFMVLLTEELDEVFEPLRDYVLGQSVASGLLYDQAMHAVLLFGVRCQKFHHSRLTIHLNSFVSKLTTAVYKQQALSAMPQ